MGEYVSADASEHLLVLGDLFVQLRFRKSCFYRALPGHVPPMEYLGRRAVLPLLAVGRAIPSAKSDCICSLADAGDRSRCAHAVIATQARLQQYLQPARSDCDRHPVGSSSQGRLAASNATDIDCVCHWVLGDRRALLQHASASQHSRSCDWYSAGRIWKRCYRSRVHRAASIQIRLGCGARLGLSWQDLVWAVRLQSNRKDGGLPSSAQRGTKDRCACRMAGMDGVDGLCGVCIRVECGDGGGVVSVAGGAIFKVEGEVCAGAVARRARRLKERNPESRLALLSDSHRHPLACRERRQRAMGQRARLL